MAKVSHLGIVRSDEPSDNDPIFAAIERHRRVAAIWGAAVNREMGSRSEQRAMADRDNALDALVWIKPTTIRGVIALLKYYTDCAVLDEGEFWPDCFGDSVIRHAANALERIAQLG